MKYFIEPDKINFIDVYTLVLSSLKNKRYLIRYEDINSYGKFDYHNFTNILEMFKNFKENYK